MGGAPPLPLDFAPQGGKIGRFFALFTPQGSAFRALFYPQNTPKKGWVLGGPGRPQRGPNWWYGSSLKADAVVGVHLALAIAPSRFSDSASLRVRH